MKHVLAFELCVASLKTETKGKIGMAKVLVPCLCERRPRLLLFRSEATQHKKITCGIAPTTVTVLVTLIEKKSSRSLSTQMFWLTKNQERGPIRNCSRPQSALKREQDNRGRGNAEI